MTPSSLDRRVFYVDEVRFSDAEPRERGTGLIGYVSFRLNRGLRIDGVTVRQTRKGKLCLSFPARRGLTGRQFFFIQPIDGSARSESERQVLQALGFEEAVPR